MRADTARWCRRWAWARCRARCSSPAFGGTLRKRRLALISAAGFGTALVATALAPNYWVAFALLAVVGCSMVLQSISANTLLQQEAPDHLRGRVMGFYSFVVLGMAPFGALQIGWISQHFGTRVAFGLGGTVCVASAIYVWRRGGGGEDGARRPEERATA